MATSFASNVFFTEDSLKYFRFPPTATPSESQISNVSNKSGRSIASLTLTKTPHAPPLPRDKDYHIFFSCLRSLNSPSDRRSQQRRLEVKWVKSVIQELESDEYEYKCCYPDRDFTPGKLQLQEMIDCISRSLRVVIVLNREYLKTELTQFESQFVHFQMKNVPFIPVVLDDCEVPERLKGYCSLYPNDDRRWWKKFIRVIRGNAPSLPDGKTDHVFIIHSNARQDIEWVESLIQFLEAPENFVRCTSAHQARLGKATTKNPTKQNIDKAMMVMVVLTSNFKQKQWNEYKDYLMDENVYLLPVAVDPNSYRPPEIEDCMYLDATVSENIWRKQLLEMLICEDKPDQNPIEPPRRISALSASIRSMSQVASEQAIREAVQCSAVPNQNSQDVITTVTVKETSTFHQDFDVQYHQGIPFDEQLQEEKALLCFGKIAASRLFDIRDFDVTRDSQIVICLTCKETKHMLFRINTSGEIIWKKKLKHQPISISCTDRSAFILSRTFGSKRRQPSDLLQIVALEESTQDVHVHEKIRYEKCYCLLALNNELVVVSHKGDDSVKTIELERGRCIHRLIVRSDSSSEFAQSPRQMTLSSSGNLLVATNKSPKIFCYAPSMSSRGMFAETCLWTAEVKNLNSMASSFYDFTVVLSGTTFDSTLVVVDEEGKRVHTKDLKEVTGPRKVACGSNGGIVVLHEDEEGHPILFTVFDLRITESERL